MGECHRRAWVMVSAHPLARAWPLLILGGSILSRAGGRSPRLAIFLGQPGSASLSPSACGAPGLASAPSGSLGCSALAPEIREGLANSPSWLLSKQPQVFSSLLSWPRLCLVLPSCVPQGPALRLGLGSARPRCSATPLPRGPTSTSCSQWSAVSLVLVSHGEV